MAFTYIQITLQGVSRPVNALVSNQVLGGRYVVAQPVNFDPHTGHLGSGQALIYKGADQTLGQPVAIKQLLNPHDADAIERHRRECAFLLPPRGHPLIVQGVDAFDDGTERFLIEEWLAGETLGAEVKRRGPLPTHEVLERLAVLATAVVFINSNRVYFRDLNEGNIIVLAGGRLKLIDFGGCEPMSSARHTKLLPPSPPPEVLAAYKARRSPAFSLESEVYAIGTVGYYMATGTFVPEDRTVNPLVPPSHVCPAVPAYVEGVLMKSLDEDPRRRYGSALELKRAVEAVLHPRPAHHANPAQPVWGAAATPTARPVAPAAPVSAANGMPKSPCTPRRFGLGTTDFLGKAVVLAACIIVAVTYHDFAAQRADPVQAGPRPHSDAAANRTGPEAAPALDRQAAGGSVESRPDGTDESAAGHNNDCDHAGLPGAASPEWVSIDGSRVNLRERGGLDAPVLCQLSSPATVRLSAVNGGWCEVEDAGGRRGFVWGAYVKAPTLHRASLRAPVRLPNRTMVVGEKVIVESTNGSSSILMLPDGVRVSLPTAILADSAG
jgi:hypothetical protein